MAADDKLSPTRRLAIGALTLAMAGAGFATGRAAFRPVENVVQPILFNHAKHVKDAGLPCSTCHEYYETSAHSGLPELATCLGCHDGTVSGTAEEKKLVELGNSDNPPRFRKLFRLPEHVYYSHRRHVAVAGLECEGCHGAIAATSVPPSRPLLRITMDSCVACHAARGVQTDCTHCHR